MGRLASNRTAGALAGAWAACLAMSACNQPSESITPAPRVAQHAPPTATAAPSQPEPTGPERVVAKLNACTTGAEALTLMTGMMKDSFASHSPEKQAAVLANLQVKGLPLRTLAVSEVLQYVIVDRSSVQKQPLAFHFEKVGGDWKFSNRTNAEGFVVGLLTGSFTPDQFDANATFQPDDETYVSKSAFATFEYDEEKHKRISIELYPFRLQQRDLEYLKTHFGLVVQEAVAPTTITSSVPYPRLDLRLGFDEHDALTSFCQNGGFFPNGRGSFGSCGLSKAGITELSVTTDTIKLVAKGETKLVGPRSPKTLRWDVDLNVPLFKKGLD